VSPVNKKTNGVVVMNMEFRGARGRWPATAWLAVGVLAWACTGRALAQAETLPGGATPGGALPEREAPRLVRPAPREVVPIPPVIDRPLDIEEGPRITVSRFVLEGASDHPGRGLTRDTLGGLLEELRRAQPEAGYTIGQLQEVANRITQAYRDAGLILSTAYVPAQDVVDGQVTVAVLEGRWGEVRLEGNERYSDALLRKPFSAYQGQVVTAEDVESALLLASDYPGITLYGVFQPGESVGETALTVKVQDERPYGALLRLDNHGSEFTGEWRTRADLWLNNPLGLADRLNATLLKAFDPANNLYGGLRYQTQYLGPDWTVGVGINRNSFDVGADLANLGISGDTTVANLFVRKSLLRSRRRNLYGQLDFARKRAEVEGGVRESQDDLAVLTAELGVYETFDELLFGKGAINDGQLQVAHGFGGLLGAMDGDADPDSSRLIEGGGAANENVGAEFTKVVARYSRLQTLAPNQFLRFTAAGQWSPDPLVSVEQFSIGGPTSVRAFPVSEYLADSGATASLEYIVNAPGFADKPAFRNLTWGQVLQVSVFADYGIGWLNDSIEASSDEFTNMSAAGAALQLSIPGELLTRLQVATPLEDREPSNDRDPQVFFEVTYQFD
jgi:hemolysin activation/secretion protein